MNSNIIIVLIIFFGLVATIVFLFSKAVIRKKNPINNNEIKNTSTLIACRDCKKEISRNAEACPHCGAPTISSNKKKNNKKIFFLILICVFAIIIFVQINSYKKQQRIMKGIQLFKTLDSM